MEDFNDGVDGNMASRMRKVHSEQFFTLVRMHLSFVLDLNTEENDAVTEKAKLKKWSLLNFTKKPKLTGSLQKEGEEVALTKESINQLKQLIEYLSKEECIKQEGIFRLTGNLNRRQALKDALYKNLPLKLEEGRYTVHDIASVLKTFLQDLPEPLLTEAHHPIHVQIAEFCGSNNSPDIERLLRSLQLLLLLLPLPNRIVLKHVLGLLNKTAAHENSNKMNCDTLATVMTPSLICPRNQADHDLLKNSQQFSGLVSFMIKKGTELFKIPPKLFTDIRAFWVEQEKKLLSPQPADMNEANADTTGTAQTVFSFVDRNATAKATATSDTQAALAQLYAYIQAMPESAKKRKLVKQFNKENGQGTPRHINQNGSGKSFGDSIKKRIFQKKLHKKIHDVKLGCNFSRSSSEENMVSNTSSLLPKMFSKSEDELSDMKSYDVLQQENLMKAKHISNSTGSINTPCASYKKKGKVILKSFLNISERSVTNSPNDSKKRKKTKSRFSRHQSEPPDMYSSQTAIKDAELMRQSSESALTARRRSSLGKKSPERTSPQEKSASIISDYKSSEENPALTLSPATKNKLRCLYAHTSTPSNLLRHSTANDYILTPITDDDKSMSPITQSATKMTKAMQETMMTPRSRKPVVMVSTSNLCGLATLHNGSLQYDSTNSLQSNYDAINRRNYTSIMEESPSVSMDYTHKNSLENKENFKRVEDIPEEQSFVTCIDEMCGSTIQKSTGLSVTNTYVYPSRSVLTASPVDLSFTSRTGDFEQSESDLIMPAEEGNNPGSDTSGIASGSTNSANNSAEKIEEGFPSSPRKRCASLQRNDSKRSFKDESICDRVKMLKQKQLSESTLNPVKVKDPLPETSF